MASAPKTGPGLTASPMIPPPAVSRARRWLVDYPRAVPLTIFVAIIAITAFSVFAIESNARAREKAQMSEYAQSIASALERHGNSFASYLRAGAALFASVDEVRPQAFQQFVSELRLDVEYRGAEGIGWAAMVNPDDVAAYLAKQRASRPDFPDLTPALDAPAPAPAPLIGSGTEQAARMIAATTYFSPDTARSQAELGYDMMSDPILAAAMSDAARTVRPVASGRIELVQEGFGHTPGFVMFMPVYRAIAEGRPTDRELAGYVYSPFNAQQFLDAALERAAPSSLGVRLYDDPMAGTSNLLVAHSLTGEGGDQVQQSVNIASRELLLVIEAPRGSTLELLSMVALLFGLAVASLLMLLARLLTQQALEDQTRLAFFEEQHSIRNSLTRELNHRVKNTLANVLSILSLTRRRTKSLDDFATSLEGRIRALSATHDLLTGTDWGTTPIRAVIEAELQHFRAASEHLIAIEGPDVELAPNDALSFGLAIHELATNAAKYGALSVPEGTVSVRWSLVADHLAEVEWREHDGPPVSSERGRGFGTELIEKIVAHELKHPVQLSFHIEGVRCVMRVPVRRHSDFQIRAEAAEPAGGDKEV
ncbi:MAG: CHASE domain-containing protein [Pseudomonadota bacterium]